MRRIRPALLHVPRLRIFQCGASTTEYALALIFAVLLLPPLYNQFSDELRSHVARAADKFAEYYYQGWFWPRDDFASHGASPAPRAGHGGSGDDGPLAGDEGGGSPGGGGGTGDANVGGGNAPGNHGQQPSGDPFGGNAGNPQLCSASPGSNSATHAFVGNPIDIGTGNKLQIEVDYTDAQPDGLQFVRSYNAFQGDIDSGVGHGWRHNWQRAVRAKTAGGVTVIRGDGAHLGFVAEADGYRAPPGVVDRLLKHDRGWHYTTGFGVIEHYDTAGRLQQIVYPSGVSHTVQYNAHQQPIAVTDNRGPRIDFNYAGERLTQITLPDGTGRLFTYDADNRLVAVHRQAGMALGIVSRWLSKPDRRYRYEDPRLPYALTALDDAVNAGFASWAYDDIGRAIRSQHGNGAETIDIRYVDEHTVTVTNAVGHPTTYTLEPVGDGRRRVIAIDGEAGLSCPELRQRNRYDAHGFLALAIEGGAQGRVLERDTRGLIQTEYQGVAFAAGARWNPVEGSIKIARQWHPHWPLATEAVRYRYRAGEWLPVVRSDYTYDAHAQLESEKHTDLLVDRIDQPAARHWRYTRSYHDALQTQPARLSVTDPRGNATHLDYDAAGRLTESRNALGQVTRFREHTAARLPGKIVLANGQTVTLRYDDAQRLTQIQRGDDLTRLAYQANGLVSQLQRADGSAFDFTYNAARQLIGIRNERGETQVFDPSKLNGDWTARTLFDSEGIAVRQHYRYQDEWGRLIGWLGNSSQLTELAYDSTGDVVAAHERNEDPGDRDSVRSTRAHYDTLHRLTALIDAAGHHTAIDYSASGHVETVTDAHRNATRFVRNGFGDVLQEINPARGDDAYRYDAVGNVIARNDTTYRYDALDRLTAIDAPGTDDDIRYTYDQRDTEHGNGIQQLTRIEAADHVIDYRYDEQGRLAGETTTPIPAATPTTASATAPTTTSKPSTTPATPTRRTSAPPTVLAYDHLPGGRLQRITYPDGSVVQYDYDGSRITAVTYTDATTGDDTLVIDDIGYAPFGGPQQWSYGNGLRQHTRLDRDGRVDSIALGRTGMIGDPRQTVLWSQRYGYDLYNNIARLEKGQTEQQFTYDRLHRLTGEQRGRSKTTFGYDGVGNRVRETAGAQTTTYTYAEGNRLTQRGEVNIALDGRGNLLEEKGRRFEYNAGHRPVSFHHNGQLAARYRYNANGLRTQKITYINHQPRIEHFAYAPDTRLLSATTPTRITHYLWLGRTPIAQIDKATHTQTKPKTEITYLHADHLLTPRVATNDQQTVVWRWDSDAFGATKPDSDPDRDGNRTTIDLRFPGQYADEESGLYYNVFRYYDPATGRYTQSDPIGLGGGLNTFSYVQGNPISNIDPLGYASCTFTMSTGRIVCTASDPQNNAVEIPVASGNNGRGQECRNNPRCTAIPNHGPIPTGCWRWTNGATNKPNGRVLEPCPGTNTNAAENRTLIRSHSCANPFGPGRGPQYCSEGCVTGTAHDIERLNELIDAEPGSTLQVNP